PPIPILPLTTHSSTSHCPLSLHPPTAFFHVPISCPHRALHSFPTRRSSDLRWRWRSSAARSPLSASDRLRPGPRIGAARSSRRGDRKSTRLNSSHVSISYAVFCLKKKNNRWLVNLMRPHLY